MYLAYAYDDASSLSDSVFRRTHSQIDVDDEQHSFPVIIVAEFESFVVLARQSNSIVVHLTTVFAMDLELCYGPRAEVMKAPVNREIIFLFLFTVF